MSCARKRSDTESKTITVIFFIFTLNSRHLSSFTLHSRGPSSWSHAFINFDNHFQTQQEKGATSASASSFEMSVSSSEEVEKRWSAFRPVGPRAPLLPALVMGRVCGSDWLVPLPALPTLSTPLLLPLQHPHQPPPPCNPCAPDCRQCNIRH